MSQEEQEQQQKILEPKFFQTQIFFCAQILFGPKKILCPKICLDVKDVEYYISTQFFFATQP